VRVVFTAQAKAGLRSIALYIARENKARSQTFSRELRARALQIADAPRIYPLIPRYEIHGVRRRVAGDYLILYRVEEDRISILHILHGAQDYLTMLFPDGGD